MRDFELNHLNRRNCVTLRDAKNRARRLFDRQLAYCGLASAKKATISRFFTLSSIWKSQSVKSRKLGLKSRPLSLTFSFDDLKCILKSSQTSWHNVRFSSR